MLLLLESQCGHEGNIYGNHVVPGAEPGSCSWSASRWTANNWPPRRARVTEDHLWVAAATAAASGEAEKVQSKSISDPKASSSGPQTLSADVFQRFIQQHLRPMQRVKRSRYHLELAVVSKWRHKIWSRFLFDCSSGLSFRRHRSHQSHSAAHTELHDDRAVSLLLTSDCT